MNLRVPLFVILLCLSAVGLAAPKPRSQSRTPQPTPTPRIFIDPSTKAVLERAANLYGATPKWSAQILHTSSLDPSPSKMTVAFARPSILKFEDRSGQTSTLEMVDGKMFSSYLKDPELGTYSKRVEQQRTLAEHMASVGPNGMGEVLSFFIVGKTGIAPAELKQLSEEATSLTVKLLPSASWKGLLCQRIVIERRYNPSEEDYLASKLVRDEHWFTQEGKLVKTIAASDGDTWKSEITSQDFKPTFGPKTFVFNPPPNKPAKFGP